MDIGYAGALLGGVISLLSPCSVMLLPAFFAYAFASPGRLIARTGVFYLGLATTLVPLGVFSGTLGSLVSTHRGVLVVAVATLVIVAGMVQLLGITVPGLSRTGPGSADRTSAVSVFLLGTVYAVAGVCAGPVLGSVLMVAALGGDPGYGGTMLALYALGMTAPLFVLAAIWPKLGATGRKIVTPRAVRIGRWRNTWTMTVSGLLSIGIGVLLLATDGTASLGGFFSIGTQYRAESWVSTRAASISNLWFVLAASLVLAAVAVMHVRRNRRGRDPRPVPTQSESHP